MEATFSLSRRSCTKPIFTPHLHVDHASYRQPPHSTQSWPTPMTRTHRLTWTVDALPKPKDHSWGGGEPSKSWSSSQGESHYKAWAVNSLPRRRGANGGEDTSPWATAFIAMTAVAACVAGAGIGMRGAMVAPPAAIAALVGLEIIARDVVASEELNGFLQADLRRPSAERVKDATTYVFRCLRDASGSRIDYPDLKENARVVVACGQAEQMMVMLKKKFSEESIRGGEKALELGLIYLEMLILLGRPDDALSFLDSPDFKKIVNQEGSKKDGRPHLYKAAAKLLLDHPDEEAIQEWNVFANAENLRRFPFQAGPKIQFEELRKSMTDLKRRYDHPHWTKFKDFFHRSE